MIYILIFESITLNLVEKDKFKWLPHQLFIQCSEDCYKWHKLWKDHFLSFILDLPWQVLLIYWVERASWEHPYIIFHAFYLNHLHPIIMWNMFCKFPFQSKLNFYWFCCDLFCHFLKGNNILWDFQRLELKKFLRLTCIRSVIICLLNLFCLLESMWVCEWERVCRHCNHNVCKKIYM